MKKIFLVAATLLMAVCAMAQEEAAPSKWKKGVDLSLQATQNYATDNWHNGGVSNLSVLAGVQGWWNYAGEKGFSWDNKVELKYGVTTTFTEDLAGRLFHLTDDKTYYETKMGYALGKGWNVAWSGDVSTTLFDNYKIDTDELVSAFAAPVYFNTAVGFDYKYNNPDKKIDLSVMIAPYAFKLIYVNDIRNDYAISKHVGIYDEALGITQLKTFNLGSSFKVNYRQEFNENITLSSVLAFYTDYKGIEVDWEIVGDFKLYKWLTARVSLNPRYDSTVGEGWNEKIQFKEFVSLGLAYRFEK
ncbi:MAG: DUF3078 domain-containing protein [Paludibacteraceae bacterium]|nr:DUF3078 domain-containing protein [Paludibacteraceae bacterium]